MEKYRVMLVDDHALFVNSLRMVLESRTDDIDVVGVAKDGSEAVEMARRTKPDVILMDVRMPVMDGVQATSRIHEENSETKIVMLTTYEDDEYVRSAIEHGAVGYLLKNMRPGELIASIRVAKSGTIQICPEVAENIILRESTRRIIDEHNYEKVPKHVAALVAKLTPREHEVLLLLTKAYENRQIARTLGISEQTAKNHIHMVYDKLFVSNRLELIRLLAGADREDGDTPADGGPTEDGAPTVAAASSRPRPGRPLVD